MRFFDVTNLQRFEENSTVISFAKSNTTFPAHTLKLNVIVRQWPFLALANSLSINIDSRALRNDGTQASDSCVSDKQDDSGSLRWMLIVVGNTSLYPLSLTLPLFRLLLFLLLLFVLFF